MHRIFLNRTEAGKTLAEALAHLSAASDLLVLGIPRGGVPVAFEVAKALQAPLDVCVVRKLGVPSDPELALGAIASGGIRVLNNDVVASLRITPATIDKVAREQLTELTRRELAYRSSKTQPDLHDKTLLLIDDGIATGATTKAAIKALKTLKPKRLILAIPTSSQSAREEIEPTVDEYVVLTTPEPFHAVAQSYAEFPQTSDAEVAHLLKLAQLWTKA